MGRGLSEQQQEILKVIKAKDDQRQFVFTKDIIDALGLKPTAVVYASVSRALSRLCYRGLVTAYQPDMCRQGKGFGYGLPGQE